MLFNRHSQLNRQFASIFMMATFILFAMGCSGASGPPRYGVSGTVTLNDQAVEAGSIRFDPTKGTKGSNAGGNIEKGSYKVTSDQGLVPGTYRVEIKSNRKTGKQIPVGSPSPPGTMQDEVVEAIPAEYNTKSTLEYTVTAGTNTKNFELVDKTAAK